MVERSEVIDLIGLFLFYEGGNRSLIRQIQITPADANDLDSPVLQNA